MPIYLDGEHVMMHLDYMRVSRLGLDDGHVMNISSSRSPSTRSVPSRHLRPQVISPTSQWL
jgi:hypothetical protein